MSEDSTQATLDPSVALDRTDMQAAVSTQLRTVALCDLVDSTALVERLGDRRAAELFRRHDRIARDLLQRHRGREIDKTDGFLVLFERPIQAVAFALDYQRALRDLGAEERLALSARVGVHVGDVLLWENEAGDIAQGAKRVEVEGLAKPVAARLMHLARPGQILLSGMAHNLAQRSQQELGALGPRVRWQTHGRFRFKGVPAPMLVHEVGEVGIAPLKPPPSGAKAQRELPLWRQPRALALEALVALGTVLVLVFALTTRPQQAIAFGERDWVVFGDLRNLTGDDSMGDALDTAFRISLEQSRFVNVVPDLTLRNALERMQQPADTIVDRMVGSEIALREGARALILPTVADIGGRIRVSAEIVDPNSGTTVYAESVDGVGLDSSLASMDQVAARLRLSLGETLQAIERDSAPLPQVTSGDLEALKAYAAAEKAYFHGSLDQAHAHFSHALSIDPGFAMAHLGLARIAYSADDHGRAQRHLGQALQHRTRLTARDALYLDAWSLMLQAPLASMQKWRLLHDMYPDYYAGAHNFSNLAFENAHAYPVALELLQSIDVDANARKSDAGYLRAAMLAAQDRLPEALALFGRADVLASGGRQMQHSWAWLAHGDRQRASETFALGTETGDAAADAWRTLFAPSAALDAGDFQAARQQMQAALQAAEGLGPDFLRPFRTIEAGMELHLLEPSARAEALRTLGGQHLTALRDAVPGTIPRTAQALAATAWMAARSGELESARAWTVAITAALDREQHPPIHQLLAATEALAAAAEGRHREALALLQERIDGSALFQLQVALMELHVAAGRLQEARAAAEWLLAHRGRALVEFAAGEALLLLNIADLHLAQLRAAEIAQLQGDAAQARAELAAFLSRWPAAAQEPALAARIQRLEAALAAAAAGPASPLPAIALR